MKKWFLFLVLLLVLLSSPAHALMHAFKGLTGAASAGDPQLNGIPTASISNGEIAIGVDASGYFRAYQYDSSNVQAEDNDTYLIPDWTDRIGGTAYTGTAAWVLKNIAAQGGTFSGSVAIGPSSPRATLTNTTISATNLIYGDGGTNITTTGPDPEHPDAGGIYKGKRNTIVGMSAGVAATTASFNTYLGYYAGGAVTSGDQNTLIGAQAGQALTTGYHNTCIGAGAGQAFTTGYYNTYVGTDAGLTDTTGTRNTLVGTSARAGTGSDNTIIGADAGGINNTATGNTLIGKLAGNANTSGANNVFVGLSAGTKNTEGDNNTFIGASSGANTTTGDGNTYVGKGTGAGGTTGYWNSMLGTGSGALVTQGYKMAAFGYEALAAATTGYGDTAIGFRALLASTGNENTALGQLAGSTATTGSNNIFIGANSGVSAGSETAANCVVIGYGATATGSNQVVLGNASTTETNIGGAIKNRRGTTGGIEYQYAEATANITAVASVTIQVNVPSGSKIIGCQLRVDSALAAGELWDAAYATGATQAIAAAQAVAKNTKVNTFFNANAATDIASAETDIAITKNGGGSFTAQGTIRAIVYYQAFTAMADAA